MKKNLLFMLLFFGIISNSIGQVSVCESAVSISLPYTTSDDTANYGNNYFGAPGNSCGNPNSYLNGNDVVYSYTSTFNGSINLFLSTNIEYVGLFVYSSCSEIGQNCLAGNTNQQTSSATFSIDALPVTLGTTYYFVISTWAPPDTAAFSLNIAANTCTNATVNYTVVSDCAAGNQFLVDLDIQNFGSATSLTVTDNQGASQQVNAVGTISFGPYPNGTLAYFTVTNNQDANCSLTSAPQTQNGCAPPNNFCSNAIDLTLLTSPVMGTTNGATNQNDPSCSSNGFAGDVYYSILVPQGTTLTIGQTDNNYDSVVTGFVGDCTSQIELTCFDDDDLTVFTYFNNTGADTTFYWVQDGYNGATGNFTLGWQISNCISPDTTVEVVSDCANGQQFLVDLNVFSLGSATSVTVTDDQGSASQNITTTGTISFGPYPNGTQVTYLLTNDQDSSCFLTTNSVTQFNCPPTCTNATVNFVPFYNCPSGGVYYVNANVTSLGTATSITLSDNQGSISQNVSSTGTYQFGPYPDYTAIIYTVADNANTDCVMTYNLQSFSNCPPINDICSQPIVLVPGSTMANSSINTTNQGATSSAETPLPSCAYSYFGNYSNDVWYTVTVPASGSITVSTSAPTNSPNVVLADTALQIYSGSCNTLVPIQCNGTGGDNMNTYASISLTGRTPGELLYVRAYGAWGLQGGFAISGYDASLSNSSFDTNRFGYYPVPVKDILNFTNSENISKVAVYNLLGQEISAKFVNSDHSKIDMSTLANGTYIVKLTALDNKIETIKVIKE